MSILIVDDESLARDRLKRILQDQNVVGEAANGEDALKKITELKPDVVLLDIRMPGMDGLEVACHLTRLESPPAIIFITAYDEYALKAFQVHAVDYLLKPIRAERLQQALNKALTSTNLQWQLLNRQETGLPKARLYLSSRSRRGIVLIPVGEVYYFRAEHKYVTVRCVEGEFLVEETLKELEIEFAERFVRIHRNCLIARSYLQALEKDGNGQPTVRLRDVPELIEVSRRHLAKIRQLLNNHLEDVHY